MLHRSLRMRLLLPVLALVVVVVALATAALAKTEASRVRSQTAAAIQRQSFTLQGLFSVTRSIMLERVHSAMRLLRQQGDAMGSPALGKSITVPGRTTPTHDLLLGNLSMGNNAALVDAVTRTMGGTAAVFSRTSGAFVCIASTMKNESGRRATGVVLDPNGPVVEQIRDDKSFYGIVDILGTPYIAGYAPIHADGGGPAIGVWHVAYPADLDALDRVVGDSRVLESGFIALFDSAGTLRFRSRTGATTDPVLMTRIARNRPADWVVHSEPVPGWGLTLVSAYPKSDVTNAILRQSGWIGGAGLLVGLLLLALQSMLIRNRVIKPLQHLTVMADELSLGRWNHGMEELDLKDEIGTLARAINRLSNSVRLAMDRLSKR